MKVPGDLANLQHGCSMHASRAPRLCKTGGATSALQTAAAAVYRHAWSVNSSDDLSRYSTNTWKPLTSPRRSSMRGNTKNKQRNKTAGLRVNEANLMLAILCPHTESPGTLLHKECWGQRVGLKNLCAHTKHCQSWCGDPKSHNT